MSSPNPYLTPRERELLTLLSNSLTVKEAAEKMDCSFHTAKTFLERIYHKIGVTSQAGAVAWALRAGQIQ